jgi:hypothetical protein
MPQEDVEFGVTIVDVGDGSDGDKVRDGDGSDTLYRVFSVLLSAAGCDRGKGEEVLGSQDKITRDF